MTVNGKEITTGPELEELREELAAYAHEAWSGWMRYLFAQCYEAKGGGITIPSESVARWTRQMCQDYKNLPITENASDLDEADKMIAIIAKHFYMAIHKSESGQKGSTNG